MRRWTMLLLLAAAAVAPESEAGQQPASQTAPAARPTYRIPRTTAAIRVDGSLDDAGWQAALHLEVPFEVNPGDNLPAGVRTDALLTYDDDRVYVGFLAHDPEPERIRARLSDRDRAFQDDFVGIVIDTFNDQRRAFELFANPLGVQMDLVVDDVAGSEDESWDTIWDSAGRITGDGYVVEMSVPYTSLRFQRGSGEQTWGLDLIRIYPRDRRYLLAMNRRDRNVSCYVCQVAKVVGFDGAAPGKNLEVVPTLTASRTDAADAFPGGRLAPGSTEVDPGVTARWGITPNLTLSGTVNPDFSQVEADVAQLDVNEEFALFYPEKRPFFLEGSDFFDTPLRAVHTRTIADPAGGLKLTGKEGKNALGAFVVQDDVTNLLFPGSEGSDIGALDAASDVGVLRYRRDVWNNATIGGLATFRRSGDYENDVLGADALLRPTDRDSLRLQILGSATRYPDATATAFGQPTGRFSDRAFSVRYSHDTRNWYAYANYDDLGRDFRADVGFMPQVDYRKPVVGGSYVWWGDPGDTFSRIVAGGDWDQTQDQSGKLIEREIESWLRLQGPRESFLSLDGGHRVRGFRDDLFDQGFFSAFFEVRPVGDLYLSLQAATTKRIDFAFVDPMDPGAARQGEEISLDPYVRLNLGRHVRMDLSHDFRTLALDEGTLFRAGLTQMTLAYQATVRMFFRAILQYTDVHTNLDLYPACVLDPASPDCGLLPEETHLFTQLLFSYKVNPQTAIYAGYSDAQDGLQDVPLTRTTRTFFFKVGYAWVF